MIITVFTDSHIGFRRFKKESAVPMYAFQECIERSRDSDVTIFAGDLFDSIRLAPAEIRQVQLAVRRLPFYKALFGASGHMILIAGNHERIYALELLDCALTAQLKGNLVVPNFYLINNEILVVYAINYMQSETAFYNLKLAKADPFFDKNPHLAAFPRVAVLILHYNNAFPAGVLDLQFVHDFNQTSRTKITYVVNGHEHNQKITAFSERAAFSGVDVRDSTQKYYSELAFVYPGTFMRTKLAYLTSELKDYKAQHFVQINTLLKRVQLSSISSKQVAFRASFTFDCELGVSKFTEFVDTSFREVVDYLFELESLRFYELDDAAIAFAASRCDMTVDKYAERVAAALKAKDMAVYKDNLLFKPAVIVDVLLINATQERKQAVQTTDFNAIHANFDGIFENDNFFEISFEKQYEQLEQQGSAQVWEMEGIKFDYTGIKIIEDYVKQKIEYAYAQTEYVYDIDVYTRDCLKQYSKVLEDKIWQVINVDDDLAESIEEILKQAHLYE